MSSARTAATRLTSDSSASERRPTEPVIAYATAFKAMVARAVAMESQAKRASEVGLGMGQGPFMPWLFAKPAYACLKEAHAPPGLRRCRRVQREPASPPARAAQARLPCRAAPRPHRRGSDAP